MRSIFIFALFAILPSVVKSEDIFDRISIAVMQAQLSTLYESCFCGLDSSDAPEHRLSYKPIPEQLFFERKMSGVKEYTFFDAQEDTVYFLESSLGDHCGYYWNRSFCLQVYCNYVINDTLSLKKYIIKQSRLCDDYPKLYELIEKWDTIKILNVRKPRILGDDIVPWYLTRIILKNKSISSLDFIIIPAIRFYSSFNKNYINMVSSACWLQKDVNDTLFNNSLLISTPYRCGIKELDLYAMQKNGVLKLEGKIKQRIVSY